MKKLIAVSTLLAWLLSGCVFDNDKDEKFPEVSEFPLEIGNTWVYRLSYDYHDSLGNSPDISMEVEVTWEITDHDSVFWHDAYEMEVTHNYLSGTYKGKIETAKYWYEQKDGSLGSVANEGHLYMLYGQLFKMTDRSDLYPWFVTIAVYPLSIGETWDFSVESDILSEKTVVDREYVTVPAGIFPAYYILRKLASDDIHSGSGEFWKYYRQWFSTVGLVKMSVTEYVNELEFVEGEHIEHKAVFTINTTMELVEYNLK